MNLRLILSLSLAGFLAACSFGADEGRTSTRGRIIEQLNRSRAEMQPILGNWSGTLLRGTNSIALTLSIDAIETIESRNADGDPVYRVDPTATLRAIEDNRYSFSFAKGTFYPETSAVVFNNPDAKKPDDLRSLTLRLVAPGRMEGDLKSVAGSLGTVVFTRDSNQSGGNTVDEEERQFQLDESAYKLITGLWQGDFKATNAGGSSDLRTEFQICVSLYIDKVPTETNRLRPTLRAYYTRSDIGEDILRRTLFVTYNRLVTPPTIFMTSNPTPQPGQGQQGSGGTGGIGSGGGMQYAVSIVGQFPMTADGSPQLDRINATHTSVNQGLSGPVILRKLPAGQKCFQKPTQPSEPKPPGKPPGKPPRRGKR